MRIWGCYGGRGLFLLVDTIQEIERGPVTQRDDRPHARPEGAHTVRVTVLIPCLDEAEHIEECVTRARKVLAEHAIPGEVIVVDNGSTDGSGELAATAGARVVQEPIQGYGMAYLAGLSESTGDYIVMLDADLTYDFEDIPRFISELDEGADFVIGDRMDNIQPGAMHWLNRYVGNPVLSRGLNLFYRTGVRDAHCGMRALRRDVIPRLDLRSGGMEFASEMVVRAAKVGLDIRQFPIDYYPRSGRTKLARFRDGWRHIRFLLVHSPTHLFLVPGGTMAILGTVIQATVLLDLNVFGRTWDVHALIAGGLLMIVGTQVIALGLCAHAYGLYFMQEEDEWFDRVRRRFRLEHGLLLGAGVALVGFALVVAMIVTWAKRGFGELSESRLAIVAATLIVVGLQVLFSSFLLSILGLRRAR